MNTKEFNLTDTRLGFYRRIVVVGCGGTGSYLIPVLCRYLSSVKWGGTVLLVDGDKFEEHNADRQEFSPKQVGQNKADAMLQIVRSRISDFNVIALSEYVGRDNVDRIIEEDTLIFSCVDNHVCRALLSSKVQCLTTGCLISAGNTETDGNVQVNLRSGGAMLLPPIEVRHPEILTKRDGDRSEMSCEEIAGLPGGGQVIIANMTAACIALQMFYGLFAMNMMDAEEVYFDIRLAKTRRIVNGCPE